MTMLTQKISQLTVPTPYAVGDVHMYVLKDERFSIIDAGVNTDEAWEAVLYQLKEMGYGPEDVEQIILTHHHPDHIGLIERFPRITDVVGHHYIDPWLRKEESFLQSYEAFFTGLYKEAGVPDRFRKFLKSLRKPLVTAPKSQLTIKIDEGDQLPGHPGWEVVAVPGHAQSHVAFYHSREKALIGGDVLLKHISSNPLLEPPLQEGEPRPIPQLQYRDTLAKLLNIDFNTVYPGHGDIFTAPHDLIKKRLEKQKARAFHVCELIGKKALTAFQVCELLFPSQMEKEFGLTMSETIGQLDYLLSIGALKAEKEDEALVYSRLEG
ncbi:MBL fold metallo-hydrolase [Thalassobacillus pellis]|uniref:MBL fold metallo-hydrolase n=1 Tax=Thalassobacillus pellis TaxID=748008 RepID=UPI0019615342|nr:MBL fold metallo-hydrolase [Thalassobacillus pellis]MBM7552380.1 glyoxylase-like metal-dependent hydrolase (beta-lactamase superfamily II) [Thalassobacillus pellis]